MQYFEFGKFIKNKRLLSGKTLNGFAFDNKIEPAVLSRIENLKQGIKLDVLIKIANGFGLTPSQLLAEFEQTQI